MSKVFFVYAPDFTDEGAPERRNKVRPEHLAAAKLREGTLLGGPMIDESGTMRGSTMFVNADSEEEVRKRVEEDIYYKSGSSGTPQRLPSGGTGPLARPRCDLSSGLRCRCVSCCISLKV
ncbi:hypothetical protein CALVIDRAFT_601890 [Calocera viscosa TUFC12733]|uniref:YCII-related domain-containing protein n=1 Tax=Calocera viscosa (strain TUFC12733) TaxID=1330018 RepID=A0A167HSF5_CALVF|nr:hypothetical protein CALVIDRAFT_601890 [Calocera viscosa TUFC12733]